MSQALPLPLSKITWHKGTVQSLGSPQILERLEAGGLFFPETLVGVGTHTVVLTVLKAAGRLSGERLTFHWVTS